MKLNLDYNIITHIVNNVAELHKLQLIATTIVQMESGRQRNKGGASIESSAPPDADSNRIAALCIFRTQIPVGQILVRTKTFAPL